MQPAGIISLVDALVCKASGYSLHGITVTSGLYLAFALALQRYNYKPFPGVSLNYIMVCYTLLFMIMTKTGQCIPKMLRLLDFLKK